MSAKVLVFLILRLLVKLLETLNEHLMCFDIQEDNNIRRELLDFTTDVIVQNGSSKLQNQAKTLMASLFNSKNDFFDKKVRS